MGRQQVYKRWLLQQVYKCKCTAALVRHRCFSQRPLACRPAVALTRPAMPAVPMSP